MSAVYYKGLSGFLNSTLNLQEKECFIVNNVEIYFPEISLNPLQWLNKIIEKMKRRSENEVIKGTQNFSQPNLITKVFYYIKEDQKDKFSLFIQVSKHTQAGVLFLIAKEHPKSCTAFAEDIWASLMHVS